MILRGGVGLRLGLEATAVSGVRVNSEMPEVETRESSTVELDREEDAVSAGRLEGASDDCLVEGSVTVVSDFRTWVGGSTGLDSLAGIVAFLASGLRFIVFTADGEASDACLIS